MIDISREQPISFTEAAKVLPRRRAGRKVHPATIHRWATKGHKGVALEFINIGGTRCTSLDALQRFFDRLTEIDQTGHSESRPTVSRAKSIRLAESRVFGNSSF